MTMRPDVKERWVTALRSGQYRQGRGYLHNVTHGTYCPLGVLAEIAIADGVKVPRVDTLDYAAASVVTYYHGLIYSLPERVTSWAGLDSPDPWLSLPLSNERGALSYLNDVWRLTFDQIAGLIDEQL